MVKFDEPPCCCVTDVSGDAVREKVAAANTGDGSPERSNPAKRTSRNRLPLGFNAFKP
jgi:hypothetical protein